MINNDIYNVARNLHNNHDTQCDLVDKPGRKTTSNAVKITVNIYKTLCAVTITGLLLFSAQAKAIAIDVLTVDTASLNIDGVPIGAASLSALVTMGAYQDPILSFSGPGGLATATIYTTGDFGAPVPTGTINEPNLGDIFVDFSSLRAQVSSPIFNADFSLWPLTQPADMGSVDGSGNYTLTWSIIDVPHHGSKHNVSVSLSGVATVVPIPAAIWLLGSGLLGLIAVGRRRC